MSEEGVSNILGEIKQNLNITWDDEDTDKKLKSMLLDGEKELNHILGAEVNYLQPGMEHRLFLNYMIYAWNDCLNEFEDAYRKQIMRIQHIYMVRQEEQNAKEI